MVSPVFSPPAETPPELAAITIDSGAALVLCEVMLGVLAQMPRARTLMREAAERRELDCQDSDPTAQAAAMIAVDRLLDACDHPAA